MLNNSDIYLLNRKIIELKKLRYIYKTNSKNNNCSSYI